MTNQIDNIVDTYSPPCAEPECAVSEFTWDIYNENCINAWTHHGFIYRQVRCLDNDGNTVDDSFCIYAGPKPSTHGGSCGGNGNPECGLRRFWSGWAPCDGPIQRRRERCVTVPGGISLPSSSCAHVAATPPFPGIRACPYVLEKEEAEPIGIGLP